MRVVFYVMVVVIVSAVLCACWFFCAVFFVLRGVPFIVRGGMSVRCCRGVLSCLFPLLHPSLMTIRPPPPLPVLAFLPLLQGATCYMNSLLQQLYHVPEFSLKLLGLTPDKRMNGDGSSQPPAREEDEVLLQLQVDRSYGLGLVLVRGDRTIDS